MKEEPDKLNFKVRHYHGCEVLSLEGDVLTEVADIYEGRGVLLGTFTGYWKGVVKKSCGGEYYADDDKWQSTYFEYAKDDRNCWIYSGLTNKEALKLFDTKEESK